jgi:hypothetical protein
MNHLLIIEGFFSYSFYQERPRRFPRVVFGSFEKQSGDPAGARGEIAARYNGPMREGFVWSEGEA